jgi:hypothetical protein
MQKEQADLKRKRRSVVTQPERERGRAHCVKPLTQRFLNAKKTFGKGHNKATPFPNHAGRVCGGSLCLKGSGVGLKVPSR